MTTGFVPWLKRSLPSTSSRDWTQLAILAVVYFLAARFGLAVSAVNRFAALLWPPSGIAMAAILIFRPQLWPAIFVGAFFANVYTGAPALAAIGIAAGNTLEAVLGSALCRHRHCFSNSLEKVRDAQRLVLSAVFCPLVSATLGVFSLYSVGALSSAQFLATWTQWWAGDSLSILAITPLILVFSTKNSINRLAWSATSGWEKLAYIFVLTSLSALVLKGSPILSTLIGLKGIYVLVPILIWGSIRFGQRGSVMGTFTICALSIWYTFHERGPFAGGYFVANLFHLLFFTVTMAVTGLLVSSLVSERELERQNLKKSQQELSAAKESAEAASLAKSNFLANMSHEIRTPLGAVIGFAELVASDTDPTQKANYIAAINRNGELLSNLINDILDLSKIEAGKVEINIGEVAIFDILKDVKTLLSQPALNKGIDLQFKIDSTVPSVIRTDPLRLRQILINLVGNAVKFTPNGYVLVQVKLTPAKGSEASLEITVTDSGIGIREEDTRKLFASFSQVDTSSKRKYGGTGLGLALSRRLARLLGGDIVLSHSAPGRGSAFKITIDPGPVHELTVAHNDLSKNDRQDPRSFADRHILLVEDSVDNQVLIHSVLNAEGAHIDIANNGQEALENSRAHDYDLIIMDLQMPIMDGYEAVAELRRRGYRGKIVALTAHALESERQRCLSSGFDEHLSKPINRQNLIENLNRLL